MLKTENKEKLLKIKSEIKNSKEILEFKMNYLKSRTNRLCNYKINTRGQQLFKSS